MYVTPENLYKNGYGKNPNLRNVSIVNGENQLFDYGEIIDEVEMQNHCTLEIEELSKKEKNKLIELIEREARKHRYVNEAFEETSIIPLHKIVNAIAKPEEFIFAKEYMDNKGYLLRGNDLTSVDEIDGYQRFAINSTMKYPKEYRKIVQEEKLKELANLRQILCTAYSLESEEEIEDLNALKIQTVINALRKNQDFNPIIKKYVETRSDIIIHNMRLVSWFYFKKGFKQTEDNLSIGFIQLIKAVDSYVANPNNLLNNKLSTFITNSIVWGKQENAKYNDQNLIRLPMYIREILSKLEKIEKQFEEEGFPDFSDDDVATVMGLPRERLIELKVIRDMIEVLSYDYMMEQELETLFGERYYDNGILLDDSQIEEQFKKVVTCDFDNYYFEPIPENSTEEKVELKILGEDLFKTLDLLDEREKFVISMRFGLENGIPRTLADTGKNLGFSQERIRQIESQTLAKIRSMKKKC